MYANVGRYTRPFPNRSAVTVLGGILIALLSACSSDESLGVNTQFATDSFANPTEHGELVFDIPNEAAFDDQHRFHSWVFTLTDQADVDLLTDLRTVNLDTKMYLYRWEIGATTWGHNIANNDDHAGTLASRITRSLSAGDYRIKVKATKTQLRGHFAVLGYCSGDGCPTPIGGQCDPNSPAVLPPATGLTASIPARLVSVLTTPKTSDYEVGFQFSERCDQVGLVSRSVDYFRSFWTQHFTWEEFAYFNENDTDAYLEAYVDVFGDGGAKVTINLAFYHPYGTSLTFVYDADDKLVLLYRGHDDDNHNVMPQIPRTLWFGGELGEPTVDEPAPDCVKETLWTLPRSETTDLEAGQGTHIPNDWYNEDLYSHLRAVSLLFVEEHGLVESDPVDYSFTRWRGAVDRWGNDIEFTAGAVATSYLASDSLDFQDTARVLLRTEDGITSFVCQDRN